MIYENINYNGNNSVSYNDFSKQPLILYKILEFLMTETSQPAEDFWKCLVYDTKDALDKENLTFEQKKAYIWTGDTEEQKFRVFMKPIIGSILSDSKSQTQFRLFRSDTIPETRNNAVVCYDFNFFTNEKTCLVYYNGVLCERTDLMESLFLTVFNGRDIGSGTGYLCFDRDINRGTVSNIGLTNSKTLFGRSLTMALRYINLPAGSTCDG